MIFALPPRTGYSRAELISDFAVHAVGLAAALVAVPVLVVRASALQPGPHVVAATSIYGATLVAMILFSLLYNMTHPDAWTRVLRRIDHSAIYFKIAGTYTPFALLSPSPATLFLAWIWACAAVGAGLRSFAQDRLRSVAVGLYLVMGWSGAVAGWAVFDGMAPHVFALILTGGLLYTCGFAFHLWRRLPFHNTIWHAFVIAASALLFAAVSAHVLGSTEAAATVA